MANAQVYILRGPSGSGKSHYGKNLVYKYDGKRKKVIVSADHFFNNFDRSDYNFNPALLPLAHSECFLRYLWAIADDDIGLVIVDNTNIHLWEFQNYVQAAKICGCFVTIVECVPETIEEMKVCIFRNQHSVPAEVIAKMCIEFEPAEGAIKIPIVKV
jgi:tRNA uridine 5-carbamoylmethylation protein Kti12